MGGKLLKFNILALTKSWLWKSKKLILAWLLWRWYLISEWVSICWWSVCVLIKPKQRRMINSPASLAPPLIGRAKRIIAALMRNMCRFSWAECEILALLHMLSATFLRVLLVSARFQPPHPRSDLPASGGHCHCLTQNLVKHPKTRGILIVRVNFDFAR